LLPIPYFFAKTYQRFLSDIKQLCGLFPVTTTLVRFEDMVTLSLRIAKAQIISHRGVGEVESDVCLGNGIAFGMKGDEKKNPSALTEGFIIFK
jgi:hypothetical protein